MSLLVRTAMLPVLICACARAPAHPEISEVPVTPVREQGEPPAQSGTIVRLYHSTTSTLNRPVRKVVRDSAGWVDAWALLRESTGRPGPLPSVDFSKHMVVMVGLGDKASTGHDITVDSVTVADSDYLVFVQSTDPNNCPGGAALTQPVDVVRIPRSGLPVRFVERIVKLLC